MRRGALVLLAEKTFNSGRVILIAFQLVFHLSEEGLALGNLAKQSEKKARFGAGLAVGRSDVEVVIEELGSVESDLGNVGDGGVGRHNHELREILEMFGVGFGMGFHYNEEKRTELPAE